MLAVLSKVAVDARNLFPEYAGHPNDDVSVSVIVDVRCFSRLGRLATSVMQGLLTVTQLGRYS